MANTYAFINAESTIALRSGDNAHVPWNPQANEPLDINGSAGRIWKGDGSPIPDAYVAPPPSAEDIRQSNLLADTDRQTIVNQITNATPQQIKNYINNNVTDLASARAMLMRLALLVGLDFRR